MIRVIKSMYYKNVCGAAMCYGHYLMQPKDSCIAPASPNAMLGLNTSDGTVKVSCSVGSSPWGEYGQGYLVSCFPNSSMIIFCLDKPDKRWCEGMITTRGPSEGK